MRSKSKEERDGEKMEDLVKTFNKTKMAAWFVSNCHSHSGREKIVNVMKSMIKVNDI